MTTFKHPNGITWRYDFYWRGRRYTGSTDQLSKKDADLVEARIKTQLRQQAWGILPVETAQTPKFSEWAGHYFTHQERRLTRPDILERTLRIVLAFFGAKPSRDPVEGGVYHDLRLGDLVADPDWLGRFETWMQQRGVSNSTRNSYLSALSGMYKLALRPQWRKHAHLTSNPIEGTERRHVPSRQTTLTVEQLRAVIRQAAPHIRLALAIGALAPKLRLASILALRWEHFDLALEFITNPTHKTIRTTGRPQVAAVDPQLRDILAPLVPKTHRGPVITYRGNPIKDIKTGLMRAVEDAGLTYGREGASFHTLRHTMATLLAELGVPDQQRKLIMGHQDIRTTEGYTHMRPTIERAPLAQLSNVIPIKDAVQGPVQGPRDRAVSFPEGKRTAAHRASAKRKRAEAKAGQ